MIGRIHPTLFKLNNASLGMLDTMQLNALDYKLASRHLEMQIQASRDITRQTILPVSSRFLRMQ